MLHYYLNLYNGNENRARTVSGIAKNQFGQFDQYLRNSIRAMKRKEISASWEKIEVPNLAELRIKGGLYQYTKRSVIKITDNRKGYYRIKLLKGAPNFSKKLEYQIGGIEGEADVEEELFQKGLVYLKGVETAKFDAVKWGFADVELTPTWLSFQENMKLYNSSGVEYKVLKVNNDEITIKGDLPPDGKFFYGDTEFFFATIKKAKLPAANVEIIRDDRNEIIFYSEKGLGRKDEIDRIDRRAKEFMDFDAIFFAKNPQEKLKFKMMEKSGDMTIILVNNDYGETVLSNKLKFDIVNPRPNNVDNYKIQLKVNNSNNDYDDGQEALSQLDYFFSENVSIWDDKKNKYIADKRVSNKKDHQIVLRKKIIVDGKQKKILCRPPDGSILRVQAEINSLEKQSKAVLALKQRPHKNHEMLIRLFEKKDEKQRWAIPPVHKFKVDEWFVLWDEQRSGCLEQREFIEKALNTPDFAILEGPPGSGKTTVILELICQLVSQKKRVLLCGSTNVSIDNVLERLIEKKDDNRSLMDRVDMLPVRIGIPDSVEPNVAKYQMDKLTGENTPKEQRELKQRLLLDAANLVCGTTMGIINHPKIKEQSKKEDIPIIPEFDYLIIDESSKTTFQEFLVPALYAKRWILAGDVMQLSPFTEQESIEFNFEQISFKNNAGKNETLDKNIQQAVFFLEKLWSLLYFKDRNGIDHRYKDPMGKEYRNSFILPCHTGLLGKIVQELVSGRINKFSHNDIFICITKEKLPPETEEEMRQKQINQILLRNLEKVNPLELTAANFILVESGIMDELIDKFPVTHAILLRPDWETSPHAFCHNVFQQKGYFYYSTRFKKLTNSFEIVEQINEDLTKGFWSKEITWRINSENQLRLADKSKRREKLGSEIDEYTPYSVDKVKFEEARDIIAAMSFPSILESLVRGIKGKKPRSPSTISDGFDEKDLKPRKTILTFQHRMHPDISEFPRKRFYTRKDENSNETVSLLDLESPEHIRDKRQWDYNRYDKRSIWVNVDSPTKGGRNIYEVEAMMRHLKDFLKYAVKHEPREGKKWEVACLAFYTGQEDLIREGGKKYNGPYIDGLLALEGIQGYISTFRYNEDKIHGPYPVIIRLHSVDKFQGQEADFVLLSMSQTHKDGFLDNPNRLNVSITRARFQLLIFGKYEYFSKSSSSDDLRALAKAHADSIIEWSSQ